MRISIMISATSLDFEGFLFFPCVQVEINLILVGMFLFFLWASSAFNSQAASEPTPLSPELLCKWRNWREAGSGGCGLCSLNVYFQPLFLTVWRS